MNRVCLTKAGKLIEMQSGGDDRPDLTEMRLNTLKQNALNAGHKEDEIEVKWVSEEEWAVIREANKPVPTYRELRAAEYPPMADYLDAQVKKASSDPKISAEGEAQEQSYLEKCLEIKAKYQKQ